MIRPRPPLDTDDNAAFLVIARIPRHNHEDAPTQVTSQLRIWIFDSDHKSRALLAAAAAIRRNNTRARRGVGSAKIRVNAYCAGRINLRLLGCTTSELGWNTLRTNTFFPNIEISRIGRKGRPFRRPPDVFRPAAPSRGRCRDALLKRLAPATRAGLCEIDHRT
jgi:hypothetical protein